MFVCSRPVKLGSSLGRARPVSQGLCACLLVFARQRKRGLDQRKQRRAKSGNKPIKGVQIDLPGLTYQFSSTDSFTGHVTARQELDKVLPARPVLQRPGSLWDTMLEAAQQTTAQQVQGGADSTASYRAQQDLIKALGESSWTIKAEHKQELHFHVQLLTTLENMGCNMRLEAKRAVAHSSSEAWLACDSQAVIPIAYSRLGQIHLDWLAQAAQVLGPGAKPVLAKTLVEEILWHSDSMAYLAMEVGRFQAGFPQEKRWASESFFLAVVGPWMTAATTALACLPQAPSDRRDVLRLLAARYARYLIGCSMLTDVPLPLKAVKGAGYEDPLDHISRPLIQQDRDLFAEAPFLTRPFLANHEDRFADCVTTTAVLPLVKFAEAQLLLRLREASWDVDELFVPALALHFAVCCLAARLDDIPLTHRHLLYRAVHLLLRYEAPMPATGMEGSASPAERGMSPGGQGIEKRVSLVREMCARFLTAYNQGGNLQSQGEWTDAVKQLFGRVSELLSSGAICQAEALLQEHVTLLQEPVLITLDRPAPNWTELGGPQLLEAAIAAGAVKVPRQLKDMLAGGPYAASVHWTWVALLCHTVAGEFEEVICRLEREASPYAGDRPGLPLAVLDFWQNLGEAYYLMATHEHGSAFAPRLLEAAARLQLAREVDLSISLQPMALKAVGGMASSQEIAPLLPEFHKSLAASAIWPAALVCEAFIAMLETGQTMAALEQLGQLVAGLLGGEESFEQPRSPAKQQGLALQQGILLLERPASEKAGIDKALSDLPWQAAGPAACLLAKLILERGDARAAWQLLHSALAAACRHDPSAALACVQAMYKAGSWQEVVKAADAIQSCKAAPAGVERQLLHLAALSEARCGRVEQAVKRAAGVSAGTVADVADVLLKQRCRFSSQVAEQCIAACNACGRASTTTALYQGLDSFQRESLPVKTHAAAACAYLRSAQSSSSASNEGSSAVEGALELLQRHAVPLRFLCDMVLAGLACDAAIGIMQGPAVQQGRGTVLAIWSAHGGKADSQALSQNLLPPVRLFLWGLKMLHEAGAAPAELQAKLKAAVAALDKPGKSGQLLAVLQALPAWVPGLQPATAHWGTLLCAARRDAGVGREGEVQLDASMARQLSSICSELRQVHGPSWVDKIGTAAAQVAVLATGEALSDYSLTVDVGLF